MNCPKCGKELEIKNKQVGTDENNNPILNEYAICRDCKKQWNLNKQKEKKEEVVAPKKAIPSEEVATPRKKKVPQSESPRPKKRPVSDRAPVSDSVETPQTYSNIPPEKVRVKRERAVKRNYEDMLATDPDRKPPIKKKRPASASDEVKKKPAPSNAPAKKAAPSRKKPAPKVEMPIEEDVFPKFQILRIIFGVVSLVLFAFFAYKGFMAGLSNISSGKNTMAGTVYIVMALCMLVSGLLLFILRNKDTILTFIIPMIFYLGSAIFAFIKRGDDKFLLIGAAIGAVLFVIFLILTFTSRGTHDEEDFDDYDDPFEDDYDN